MRTAICMLIALSFTILAAEWTVVDSYEIYSYASGLAWDGTWLYAGVYGAAGGDIYRIDPADGSYTLQCTGAQSDSYGLTWDGAYLWCTDHDTPTANPAYAVQFDLNGVQQQQFALPDHYMSGITYDNGEFWVSTYYDPDGYIYKVDNTGAVITGFTAPDNQPWDLCMQGDDLWMADYWGDALYKIDPSNGTVIESNASEYEDPSGVVFDGTYLWYIDNGSDGAGGNDWLHKVDIGAGGNEPFDVHFEFTTNDGASIDYGVVTISNQTSGWEEEALIEFNMAVIEAPEIGNYSVNVMASWYDEYDDSVYLDGETTLDIELTESFYPITSLWAFIDGDSLALDWTPPGVVRSYQGVRIERDGVTLEELWQDEPPYIVTNHPAGTFTYGVTAIYTTGEAETQEAVATIVSAETDTPPLATALRGAQPNPFNPRTVFAYSLARPGKVDLRIYNARGQLVRTLSAGKQEAGEYRLEWDGTLTDGRPAATGVYFTRMVVDSSIVDSKRCLLLK